MKHLSHASFTRNTAVVVLLLWVFALASGVANACLLEAHGVHTHTDVMEAVDDTATSEFAHGKVVEIDHQTDHSKTPCQNFCDEESKLLIKQHFSVSQPDLAPPITDRCALEFQWSNWTGKPSQCRHSASGVWVGPEGALLAFGTLA